MMLITIAIVFVCDLLTVTKCEEIKFDETTKAFKGQIQEEGTNVFEKKLQLNSHARFRRETQRDHCRNSQQCTAGQTVYETTSRYYNCHCDNACYETFRDCCPDFVKTCGPQKKVELKTTLWKCVNIEKSQLGGGGCNLIGPQGIWMIQNCPESWPIDDTGTKCLNATTKFSYPLESFLPVVGLNGTTYRNAHCAVCNGENSYITWDLTIKAAITPPTDYTFDDKVRFILANGGSIDNIAPSSQTPRRYCAGERYIDTCPEKTDRALLTECVNGPVETVRKRGQYFKNVECVRCNGVKFEQNEPRSLQACRGLEGLPDGFSIIFRSKPDSTTSQVVEKLCPTGLVFDDNLQYCREGLVTSAEDTLSDVFLVALWFQSGSIDYSGSVSPPSFFPPFLRPPALPIPTTDTTMNTGSKTKTKNENITEHLKTALVKKFALTSNQITELKFHQQNFRSTYFVATFRLTLTPFQDYIFANQNNTLNITSESLKFLELLKFTSNFTINSGGFRYPVIKLESRQLACYDGRILQAHEYVIDKITRNIRHNTTGEVFSQTNYTILENGGGNVTICRKLVLSGCQNGSFVPLNESEYTIYPNLTLFHNATNTTVNFGEYQISESRTAQSESFGNTSFPRTSVISICLPFQRKFKTTEIVTNKDESSLALRILTLVCFSISVFFLLLLLVTYAAFKELRTLPGLNLMSLAISMCLSHLIWLIGTAHFQDTVTCEFLAIIEHYLFLVSFMAMSVISYDSCVVFSHPFGISSNSLRRFIKYSIIVWLIPVVFVTVCVALDRTETTFHIYGDQCWLSTSKAVLYLFLLPVGILLMYNIGTFIKTAWTLSQLKKDTSILQKDQKQNLFICTKLASLVGFPWLFAFFAVIFPDVEALEYLFVIFVCLQGLYISLAFIFTKKTVKLYRKWWNKRENKRSSTGSQNRTPTFQMT